MKIPALSYMEIHYMLLCRHYNDVIMSIMASQITSPTIVYSTVYSGADQRKRQSSASLAFVRGIHRSAQRASNAENVSIWWRHHDFCLLVKYFLIILMHTPVSSYCYHYHYDILIVDVAVVFVLLFLVMMTRYNAHWHNRPFWLTRMNFNSSMGK